jgi:hypothetical protein
MMLPRAAVVLLVVAASCAEAAEAPVDRDVTTFRGNAQRTGWFAHEEHLSVSEVSSTAFGLVWKSAELDRYNDKPAHLYAAPLYLDRLTITVPESAGTYRTVIAGTSNDWVYAINAEAQGAHSAGAILWRCCLGKPAHGTDGGVPMGVLGTPVIDRAVGRLYVCAATNEEPGRGWKLYALDLGDGHVLPGWPVPISKDALNQPGINSNGPSSMGAQGATSQRSALLLSPSGKLVYIAFGAYGDGVPGWLVAVDTATPAIAHAFSSAPSSAGSNGGIWGAAGLSMDAEGDIYGVTGNSPGGSGDKPGVWGESLLRWGEPGKDGLKLNGTYTPFNYDALDRADIDLGASSAMLIPELDPGSTATPRLVAISGKQGNVYLIDRQKLPGGLEHRPPISKDSTTDNSLLPPSPQPQFLARGPLNVFGPYSEQIGAMDFAHSRSTPAYFSTGGEHYLVATGVSFSYAGSTQSMPPSVARLHIVTTHGKPAYLENDGVEKTLALTNPGCAVVSSNGGKEAVIWVLDMPQRSKNLTKDDTHRPMLYALDAMTMRILWRTGDTELGQGGKYTGPSIARGQVLVGTDRVYAFGVKP